MAETTNKQIIKACVFGIRNRLGLAKAQCYPILAPIYVEGQDQRVVQVCPREVNPSEAPDGGQTGGWLYRRMAIQMTSWYRLKLDQHQHSEIMLTEASDGFLDWINSIREVFDETTLGGLLTERMRYVGESATSWHDIDAGVARRDINFHVLWAQTLPIAITLGKDGVADPDA